jgi:hypothetical protein
MGIVINRAVPFARQLVKALKMPLKTEQVKIILGET